MQVRSNPDNPGARALLGDFAVQQNTSNRAYPVINSVMDGTFGPMHAMWRALWNQQQMLESQVTALCTSRDLAWNALAESIRSVYRSLQASQGTNAPTLKQYVPGGKLDVLQLPCPKLLSQMAPYVPVISGATDAVIPADIRAAFTRALTDAQSQQAAAEAARHAVTEAQRARQAQDPAWDSAYNSYHRAVEYEMEGDRQKIQMFIQIWPPTPTSSRKAAPTEETSTDTSSTGERTETPEPASARAPVQPPGGSQPPGASQPPGGSQSLRSSQPPGGSQSAGGDQPPGGSQSPGGKSLGGSQPPSGIQPPGGIQPQAVV